MRAPLIAALCLLLPVAASAQSNPGLFFGQIPTAAQWNSYFGAKADYPVPVAGLSGLGTGVATALGTAVSGSGAICLATGSTCRPSVTAATPNVVITPSPGTGAFTVGTTVPENTQAGTSYTIASSDAAKVIERTNTAGAMTDTLPNVSATGFGAGFETKICTGPITSAQQDTITLTAPSTLTYNGHAGVSSVVIPANSCLFIVDADGTNYLGLGPFGTIAEQMANAVAITGGTINGTSIGATTASTGKFTSLQDTGIASGTQCLQADASGNITGTGAVCGGSGASGANPTATGGDVAVNGSASTFLRSDGAFAIQKSSSTLFGLAKVDNSTITAAAGVITTANTTVNGQTCTPGSSCNVLMPILGGISSGPGVNATQYTFLSSGFNASATETQRQQPAPRAYTLKNLYCFVDPAPGAGNTITYTVRLNGATPTNSLTCTISNTATTANDTTDSVSIAAGDLVDMQVVTSAANNALRETWSVTAQ